MTQPQPTSNLKTPGLADVQVPDWFAQYFQAALANPLLYVPKAFETWMTDRVAVSGIDVPISQIVGFTQYTAKFAGVGTNEPTTSSTFTDLATVGPELSGIPDGTYVVMLGATASVTSGAVARMAVSVNGGDPMGANAEVSTAGVISATVFQISELRNGGNNTLTAKYRVSSPPGTGTFADRIILALRTGS